MRVLYDFTRPSRLLVIIHKDVFEDWQLDEPEGQDVETFRRVRDKVKERVEKLIHSLR
jgi:protein-tyrosine-phosphatase